MRGLLAEIGYAGAVIARETSDGLMLIDGQLRSEIGADEQIPVLVLDVTEDEANKILATFDSVGDSAGADPEQLSKLLAEIETNSAEVQAMLDAMAPAESETTLTSLSLQPPPKMTWVLIGIPTVKYGDVAEQVERLSTTSDIVIEMTANDG
jgi:hypothetical protein